MEELLKTEIPREAGYIYFVKGNPLVLFRAKMGRKKKEINTVQE